jgi:hypothetical protein
VGILLKQAQFGHMHDTGTHTCVHKPSTHAEMNQNTLALVVTVAAQFVTPLMWDDFVVVHEVCRAPAH